MAFYLRNGGILGNYTAGTNKSGIYSLSSLRLNPFASFTGFTFTNAGQTGTSGPSLAQCESEYAGAYFVGTPSFEVNNGYQSFVIPTSGVYRITMGGASGGVFTATPPTDASLPIIDSYRRATGALVVGEYTFTSGDVITMVVGQGGGDDGSFNNPGGGGGTYLTLGTYSDVVNGVDNLLFAAGGGGGGGGSGTNNVSVGVGQATTTGGSSSGVGGTNGNGGQEQTTSTNSTGGGGYFTNAGSNTTSFFGQLEVQYYSAGFRRGSVGSKQSSTTVGFGGFGGGGSGSSQTSTDNDKGGAGGYSGGGYAFDSDIFAGGGGSFAISGSNPTITAGGNTSNRHGFVTLELV